MKSFKRHLLTALGAVVVGVILGRILFSAPAGPPPGATHTHDGHPHAPAEASVWTCSMHPQIQQSAPGSCPICGMDLTPLETDTGADDGPRTLTMSKSARALADVETSVVERRFPQARIRLVGTLGYDETRVRSLTARFPARIDELFVNFTGVPVRSGEHLAKVYSPELLTAQRELLTAHRSDPDSSFARAAREKLRLWDLLPEQIDAILEHGQAADVVELRSPIGGVVVEQNVNEGDYVSTGESLFRIVDFSQLWLKLDAFESDLRWLRYGQTVTFSVQSFPGEEFVGQIVFIEPELNRSTRTAAVRVNVSNPDGRLKPGMFARGIVETHLAAGGAVVAAELAGKWVSPMHPEIVKDGPGSCDICGMDLVPAEELGYEALADRTPPLVVPTSAVLRTGKRAVAYVELRDRERPAFEGREIVLGPRAGDYFIVREGLSEGEHVVTEGAFKIDSALQIQAKPSMMNPPEEAVAAIEVALDTALAARILPAYFDLQNALASDDLDAAHDALGGIMAITGHAGPLPDLIHTMLAAKDLDELRRPHFETLSDALRAAVEASPGAFEEPILLMHCPMVYPGRGADWLQSTEPLRNPYFGASMLGCGEVISRWSDGKAIEAEGGAE